MPTTDTLINAYIDANLILLFAFLVWCLMRFVLHRTPLRRDHLTQLRLTEGTLLAAMLSPFVALGVAALYRLHSPGGSLNASDFAVAQFLDGRISMRAEEFQTLLSTRQSLIDAVLGLGSGLSIGLVALFALGVALSLGRLASNVIGLRGLIGRSYGWRRFGRTELRLSDEIAVPFSTRGPVRRYVVLPTSMLANGEEMRIAIAHEFQHLRRFDIEWEIILSVVRPIFFWNPVVHIWAQGLARLRELACDQALLERQRVTAKGYANCLVAVCSRGLDGPEKSNIAVPVVPLVAVSRGRGFAALRERIFAMTAERTRRCSRPVLALMSAALILTIGFGASTILPAADWSQDRLMLSTVVNLERLESRNVSLSLAGF